MAEAGKKKTRKENDDERTDSGTYSADRAWILGLEDVA
jgi:hypothetical protein